MITRTETLRLEYEQTRESRYGDTRKVYYSQLTFQGYYEDWARAYPGKRLPSWNKYCDVRDGVPLGTNDHIENERRRREHLN